MKRPRIRETPRRRLASRPPNAPLVAGTALFYREGVLPIPPIRHPAPRRRALAFAASAAAFAVMAAVAALRWAGDGEPIGAHNDVLDLAQLAGVRERFPRPGVDPLHWPRDHAPHHEHFAESWLFAGQVEDDRGGRHRFQLALLRVALHPEMPALESAWAAREIYAGRLLIAEAGGEAHAAQRISRAALGLAGAGEAPLRVWVEDWEIAYRAEPPGFELRAADAASGLELRIALPDEPPAALSSGEMRGYWWPALRAEGSLRRGSQTLAVRGQAMLDHLWGRALPLGSGQLALTRLWATTGDGDSVRCEQLRRSAGGGVPITECLLRSAQGESVRLRANQVNLEPLAGGWQSVGGASVPLHWHLRFPGRDTELTLRASSDSPGEFSFPPWSGLLDLQQQPQGWGLLELSNFARENRR